MSLNVVHCSKPFSCAHGLQSGHYKLPQQLQEDLTLMFANGKLYYALDKPVLGGIIALEVSSSAHLKVVTGEQVASFVQIS